MAPTTTTRPRRVRRLASDGHWVYALAPGEDASAVVQLDLTYDNERAPPVAPPRAKGERYAAARPADAPPPVGGPLPDAASAGWEVGARAEPSADVQRGAQGPHPLYGFTERVTSFFTGGAPDPAPAEAAVRKSSEGDAALAA